MEINYVLGTYPTLLEDMVAKVYETSAPNAVVQTIVIPERNAANVPTPGAGHQHPYNVVFTGLDRVPHILRLFSQSGTQFQEFNVQPYQEYLIVFDNIFFRIGDGAVNTPAAGSSIYVNTALAGLTNIDLVIHRSGTLMYPGVHYNVEPSGGFSLFVSGDVFGDEEEFLIQQKPIPAQTPVNDSVVGKQWGPTTAAPNMFLDVTSSVNYAETHLRKLIRISAAGEFHFTTTPPIGYPFRFTNMVAGTPKIFFEAAGLIQPTGDAADFPVPVGAIVEVVYDGTKFNLTLNNTNAVSGGGSTFGNITHTGSEFMVDVTTTPLLYVTIPNQGTTAYKILASIRCQDPYPPGNNLAAYVIRSQDVDGFVISFKELSPAVKDIYFDYVIVLDI